MHLRLAEGLPSSACWVVLQMVRTGAKQPQKQTVSWRSRQTQLPLSLHIPGWNPAELILGKTKQADPDPRNAQLGQERAGTANFCHVYTHHLPSGVPPPPDYPWGFLSSDLWPSQWILHPTSWTIWWSHWGWRAPHQFPQLDLKQKCSHVTDSGKSCHRYSFLKSVSSPLLSMRDGFYTFKKTRAQGNQPMVSFECTKLREITILRSSVVLISQVIVLFQIHPDTDRKVVS